MDLLTYVRTCMYLRIYLFACLLTCLPTAGGAKVPLPFLGLTFLFCLELVALLVFTALTFVAPSAGLADNF